jgi:hypothetical protein
MAKKMMKGYGGGGAYYGGGGAMKYDKGGQALFDALKAKGYKKHGGSCGGGKKLLQMISGL